LETGTEEFKRSSQGRRSDTSSTATESGLVHCARDNSAYRCHEIHLRASPQMRPGRRKRERSMCQPDFSIVGLRRRALRLPSRGEILRAVDRVGNACLTGGAWSGIQGHGIDGLTVPIGMDCRIHVTEKDGAKLVRNLGCKRRQ
jgi:hypothetical protein